VRVSAPIPQKAKSNTLQSVKKKPFIQKPIEHAEPVKVLYGQERKADDFALRAASNPAIMQAFVNFGNSLPAHNKKHRKGSEPMIRPVPLSVELVSAFRDQLNEDFSGVQVHADEYSTLAASSFRAGAITSGRHIFLNMDVFQSATSAGLELLAHELYHTKTGEHSNGTIEIQLKPLAAMNDRTPEQQAGLNRAVQFALAEQGKVNSKKLNEDNTRLGWQYLLSYFKSTLGEDAIVENAADYKPGKFMQDVIKYVKKGTAQKVKIINGQHQVVTESNVDLLPSWCGIFAFWALHQGGIHPPKWQLGRANFTAKDAFKKGDYLPRPGDIVIKNGYNHYALVVRTIPEVVVDTRDLATLKVVTINGNTAGTDHTGGQIQEKTDPYNYWDFYINPFFDGVTFKPVPGAAEPGAAPGADPKLKSGQSLGVQQYNTQLDPVGKLDVPAEKEKEKEKEEEAVVDPKTIMKQDPEFAEINESLAKTSKAKKKHDPAEKKAGEAQAAAVSPPNERMSKAQAKKVEKMGALPQPKKFEASVLKKSILTEVERLLKEKEQEANDTGEKPKINQQEIDKVKKENNKDIQSQKEESIGPVEEVHEEKPNENAVEKRESINPVEEDPGKAKKIPDTEKSVAKPIAEERITLEEESGRIDRKMADNDVDEQQLEESNEPKFASSLEEKRGSQAEAAKVKEDYRSTEQAALQKDKKQAREGINGQMDRIHAERQGQFGKVDEVKKATQSADELKRKEIADKIEKLYGDAEKSVNDKLTALETTVNTDFDNIMSKANENFRKNVNNGLDDEFTWEWAAKRLDRSDYNRRVKKVFVNESEKYKKELSEALDPLTQRIADTLNLIMVEIQAAKDAVVKFVNSLDPDLAEIGVQSAKAVMEKFASLESSVDEKQNALTNGLAKKYADGVMNLEAEFKKIMDSRKSWLEKALDAIVDAIKEIINLLSELKKALQRAAEYGSRIIKAPIKFFNNLVKGATEGFNNFVKNIAKHLLTGVLEWITGEMGEAGIQLPEKFDFKGIMSIILQVLGLTLSNIKEIAKKVIGEKYVAMMEKGVDMGVKGGEKILQIFTIIRNEGLAGLWEFIKEQFSDLKERLIEEAKTFIATTIIEAAVVKLVSMLIPGAGFISAVKSLIDFMRTLFAKAKQVIGIIIGVIDTFGEILAGNVSKVSTMIENVLGKLIGLAITFLAAILGLGKVGKKISEIIQKKIKDPINKAITKMMEKLKAVMTKLGVFKFLDKVNEKISQGKKWVSDKKEQLKEKATEAMAKVKGFLKNLFTKYTDPEGEVHTLKFKDTTLYRESVSITLANYLTEVELEIENLPNNSDRKIHKGTVKDVWTIHSKIVKRINESLYEDQGQYAGTDKSFGPKKGEELRALLKEIAEKLRTLPLKSKKKVIPETTIKYKESVEDGKWADAKLISLDSPYPGSKPTGSYSKLSSKIKDIATQKTGGHNLVRGHLINHELYGTGEDTKNLAPIPKQANSDMLNLFETDAKSLVHSNNVVSLNVKIKYGDPNDRKDGGKSLLKKKLPSATEIPVSISYNLAQLEYKGAANAKQTTINKPDNWEKSSRGLSKKGNIKINHDDFF
jgi:hypothetical protein